eukprot:UN28429
MKCERMLGYIGGLKEAWSKTSTRWGLKLLSKDECPVVQS